MPKIGKAQAGSQLQIQTFVNQRPGELSRAVIGIPIKILSNEFNEFRGHTHHKIIFTVDEEEPDLFAFSLPGRFLGIQKAQAEGPERGAEGWPKGCFKTTRGKKSSGVQLKPENFCILLREDRHDGKDHREIFLAKSGH